jgi:SAM-dependent methyltransferase
MKENKVKAWSTNAQALALLTTVHERKWTGFLVEPRDVGELSAFTEAPVHRLREVVAALEANGVVERADGKVKLTPEYAALLSDDTPFSLDDLLREARMMNRLVADAVGGVRSTPDDALTLAQAYGPRPSTGSRALYREFLDAMPEAREALRNGRYLDVGCGTGGFLLAAAGALPEMRAVGIEVVPEVAAEGARRAAALGVTERVDIRCMDARDLDEEEAYDSSFWAQPFFQESTRQPTLAAIYRALKPGARLYVQELEREPETEFERGAFAMRRLVFTGWGIPFARSAEDLVVETETAGFLLDRVVSTPFGRIIVVRRPA